MGNFLQIEIRLYVARFDLLLSKSEGKIYVHVTDYAFDFAVRAFLVIAFRVY